jgi:hypothetical protein
LHYLAGKASAVVTRRLAMAVGDTGMVIQMDDRQS